MISRFFTRPCFIDSILDSVCCFINYFALFINAENVYIVINQ